MISVEHSIAVAASRAMPSAPICSWEVSDYVFQAIHRHVTGCTEWLAYRSIWLPRPCDREKDSG